MQDQQKISNIPHMWKIVRWFLLLIVIYTFVGFLIVPFVAKLTFEHKLSQQLNREVKIHQINFNPYALSLRIEDFLIRNQHNEDALLSFKDLYVNLQIASAFKRGLILREVRVEKPYINLMRNEDGTYSISDLLEKDKEVEKKEPSEPMRFSINNIQIVNGSIDFLDGPKGTGHKARDITIKIPVISNFPYFVDTFIQPLFQAIINDTPVLLEGKTKPFHDSLQTIVDLDIEDINIPHYLAYITVPTNYKILSGTINGKNKILFKQYKDKPASIVVEGDLSLQNLKVVDNEERPLINLPLYRLKKAAIDLTKKEVTIAEAYAEEGEIFVRRAQDGTVNLQPQLPKLAKKIEKTAEKREVKPWIVLLKNLAYENFTINFEDRVPADPVHLIAGNIRLRAENISTEKNKRGALTYSFTLNKTGTVSAESSLTINPVSADVTLNLKDINIIPLQPYITDKINVLITDGAFSAEGNLSYVTSEGGELSADYSGKVSLSKFASVDKKHGEGFLKWKSLFLKGIDFTSPPFSLIVDEVALTDFYSKLVVNPDGTLNVQRMVKEDGAGTESTPSDERVTDDSGPDQKARKLININAVTLQGGTVNFSDLHIKPNFSTTMLEIGGRVSGMSSEEGSRADVELKGMLDKYAPLEIKGTINPLGEDLFVDLGVSFKGMELSPLTPYSSRYVGYTIQKGKLSLDLKYLIEQKKLESSNNMFLDQFTLGDKVESPDATSLPVGLAIALLKNRKGEINLDLPVSGQIDDPEFRMGSVVFKMITSILVKAATSPFALLGALVGGGEELSYIEFDYGSFTISDRERAKLDKLISALSDRPNLNIDIESYVDAEADREGLKQEAFRNTVRAEKLKAMVQKGQPGIPVEEITISPEEYEEYLEQAYKAAEFPKPRTFLGVLKSLPPEEMEKLMLTNIEINDDDMRTLASKRALAVKDYILKSGQIESRRVFLIETKTLEPEKDDKLKKSRVDFKLK